MKVGEIMATKKKETFHELVQLVDQMRKDLRLVEARLEASLDQVPRGEVVVLDDLPHEVVQRAGRRVLRCMFTKRQIAHIRGEEIPAFKTKKEA